MFLDIYNAILYHPLINILVFFYNIIPGHDLGIAIILLTILIKIILWPFFGQSIRAQKAMQSLQPKIDEIKEKFKDQKEKQAAAMMELYQKEKINPLSSCLPLLIQLPILIAVYRVFMTGLSGKALESIYPFINNPGTINVISMGVFDLSKPNIYMAILAGAAQFWQSKMMMAKNKKLINQPNKNAEPSMAQVMTKQMTYMMPVLTVFIGASLPSGLTFYWLLITLFTAVQQKIVFKKMDKVNN